MMGRVWERNQTLNRAGWARFRQGGRDDTLLLRPPPPGRRKMRKKFEKVDKKLLPRPVSPN